MSPKHRILGIDLGTTNSLAALLDDRQARILPNALGERLTPSAVSVREDGEILVGAAARARATSHPERTALSFKRDMGTSRKYELGPHTFTPVELSAMVLRQVREDAEAATGYLLEEAVITVPAYFGEVQRRATKDAGEIAGLRVDRIINEPTAAALAYGLHDLNRESRAVVLDLGGGTLDVTVLEIIDGVIEIQSSSGDARLGGEDFDLALAEHIARRIESTHGRDPRLDPRAWARVVQASEEAKQRLSELSDTRIALPELPTPGGAIDVEMVLSRDEAEENWQELMHRVSLPIERALMDAKLRASEIDEVLLVGGSTRMPCIARLAARLFGRMPLRTLPPDEAVALGAAVQGALKARDQSVEDLIVTDVAPFSLGVAYSDFLGPRRVDGLFCPIIERGTVIPVSRVHRFSTAGPRQTAIEINVYQGEHSHCRQNQHLGSYTIEDLPPHDAGEIEVDVRFTYDLNGLLDVDMTIVQTQEVSNLLIERTPGSLTRNQIERARHAMQQLKFHPKDALPNTTALARAEALFTELSGESRADIGKAIAMLEAALEGQDDAEISRWREHLNRTIDRHRQARF